ncbi:hypothetical protein JY651_12585 [Pyxidicoccus parkwayensis]|uniref:Lipoprotein n=1 Tax=Pyxidicoccus parkwayensis TaxID=2813578 RepID=A0ABX7P5G1_9BACT|nr:hypothetical protein [Pyxidicoccus parkwaysis]QSQ25709.1 hypothetical protein JY651_12585 [Pyxidicoccus parkwaysis]
MKNLTGVLVFSTALFLAVGCHKNTGEGPGPTDASSAQPDPRDAMEAVKDSGAPSDGAQTGTSRGALTSDGGTASKDAGGMAKGGDHQSMEACVDRWLQEHGLDKYGHPEGTMYAGGTPLFDERTGETKDRMEYVFQRKPEARQACAK